MSINVYNCLLVTTEKTFNAFLQKSSLKIALLHKLQNIFSNACIQLTALSHMLLHICIYKYMHIYTYI